jgi:hypothetical protein
MKLTNQELLDNLQEKIQDLSAEANELQQQIIQEKLDNITATF